MKGPLTKTDLASAQAGLYDCRQLRQEIEKAQACGIDCDEQELRCEHLAKFFQAILDNYHPETQPLPPN
jgi:cell fate (sporulation/competence/biofilm development) regulator YlbF (YheA/YmcA/DUF963 family)